MYMRCVYTYFQFNVMAYNPIARKTESVMAFPVSSESIEVLDENGKQVTAQVCGTGISSLGSTGLNIALEYCAGYYSYTGYLEVLL